MPTFQDFGRDKLRFWMATHRETLAALRSKLAAIGPEDWSRVDAWIAAAKPIVRAGFPEHLDDFLEASKTPPGEFFGRVFSGGGFFGEPVVDNSAQMERLEQEADRRNRATAFARILACVDSLIDLGGAAGPLAPLEQVLALLRRFPAVLRSLKTRRTPRHPVALERDLAEDGSMPVRVIVHSK